VSDVWSIAALAPGASIALTINYFNTSVAAKKFFAQVTAMSGTDVDSSPGNNLTGVPTEDDETSITLNSIVVQPCQITAQSSNVVCNNNGTTLINSDDTFGFSLLVNGTNTGTGGWMSTFNGQNYTGAFGTALTISGIPIAAGVLNITIKDAQKTTCQTTLTVNPPSPCSDVVIFPNCPSESAFPWHEWIAGVKIGSINKPSDKTPYSNFKALITDLAAGSMTPITLTTGFSYFAYDEFWRVWIDLNGDGILSETTEMMYQGILNRPANGAATYPIAGQISIPATATAGSRLMRISMKRGAYPTPCETLPFGEVEDYTVRVTAGGSGGLCSIAAIVWNQPCADAGTPNNPNDDTFGFSALVNGTNTSTSGWTAQLNGQTITGVYGVEKKILNLPISGGNIALTFRDASAATCITQGNVTAPAPCSTGGGGGTVCTPASAFPWHELVSGVKIGANTYTSGKSAYSDFRNYTFPIIKGFANPLVLTTGYSYQTYPEYWRIWIDYNKDGIYNETTEKAFEGMVAAPALGVSSQNLTSVLSIPATAATGITTMRISMKRAAYPTPCENVAFGEIEDYKVNIAAGLQSGQVREVDNLADFAISEGDLIAYPNPTSGLLNVKWNAGQAHLQLLDITGKTVATQDGEAAAEFDLSLFTEGFYFLKVEVQGKRAMMRKIVLLR
jgi:bacillolysin